jgi:four helix bundle protein
MRELKLWRESVALAGDTVKAVRASSRRETRAVTDETLRTALALVGEIAEGYGRFTPADQRHHYTRARGTVLRLETQLAVLRHADLLAAPAATELATRAQQVGRLVAGYLVYLERQDPAGEGGPPRGVTDTARPAFNRGEGSAPVHGCDRARG